MSSLQAFGRLDGGGIGIGMNISFVYIIIIVSGLTIALCGFTIGYMIARNKYLKNNYIIKKFNVSRNDTLFVDESQFLNQREFIKFIEHRNLPGITFRVKPGALRNIRL